jgi:hypothetical protein
MKAYGMHPLSQLRDMDEARYDEPPGVPSVNPWEPRDAQALERFRREARAVRFALTF